MAAISSAGGVLALLDEPDDVLKVHALKQLNQMVDQHWQEIATLIPKIETLYDDEKFPSRQLAAVVASKVFFHLQELDDALKYALGAGELFNVADASNYVETLISKCLDEYVRQRVAAGRAEGDAPPAPRIDARLESIVERMFERCFRDGQYKQVLGVALEAERLDVVERAIKDSGDVPAMLSYTYNLSQTVVSRHSFRQKLLQVLVRLYRGLSTPDYSSMCQCLLFLDDHAHVAQTLLALLKSSNPRDTLTAFQVAFDLSENQNQAFFDRVLLELPLDVAPVAGGDAAASASASAAAAAAAGPSDALGPRLHHLKSILRGEVTTDLHLTFLHSQERADMNVLEAILQKLEPRNSITHTATVMAHAMMYSGTTKDSFLRKNIDWLGRAINWAKFTATASLGVIHRGQYKESLKLLQDYLPQHGQSGSPYQEGGALYAMGLIHANGMQSAERLNYLRDALRNAGSNEIVQHGACLGIGLTALSTGNQEVYEELKAVMFTDSAVASEAAALAVGLLYVGSTQCGAVVEDMVNYAHDTKHEKTIRGIALALALTCYAKEEGADTLIEQLIRDKDPILRYGAMHAVALAYVGTSNNSAIRRLLHVAVSDVSNDVRRAAVTALGFVLCKDAEQLPRIVAQLADSFNAHVRYGAALAVGIACAGTGMASALKVLEPLLKDRVDYVRQGAFIGAAMVLMQHNKVKEPMADTLRTMIFETLAKKSDTMTKFGAILAAGILDAGGRNVNMALVSPAGHKKMAAVVGMALFPQFWYWYPLVHFLSLSFSPTAVIALNSNLAMPKDVKFVSKARPSLFAYPAPVEIKKDEKKVRGPAATLSVSKGKGAAATPKAAAAPVKKDADGDVVMGGAAGEAGKDGSVAGEAKKDSSVPEPEFEELSNPARVTGAQQPLVSYKSGQRYRPVKRQMTGFVLLEDTTPDQPESLVVAVAPKVLAPGVSEDEPAPPEPFEFNR